MTRIIVLNQAFLESCWQQLLTLAWFTSGAASYMELSKISFDMTYLEILSSLSCGSSLAQTSKMPFSDTAVVQML